MESTTLKTVIVSRYALVGNGLKKRLQEQFNGKLSVSATIDVSGFLERVSTYDVVILDYMIDDNNYVSVSNKIKQLSPPTQIVMHSSADDVIAAINAIADGKDPASVKKYSHKLHDQFI